MKRNLRNLMLALVAMLSVPVFATDIKFIPADTKATAGETSVSVGGVTISVSQGTMNRDDNYRCYKGADITFTSTVGKISNVVFECTVAGDEKYGPGNYTNATAGSYSYDGLVGIWTGEATTFSLTASTNQVRMTSIVVTVEGGSVIPDNPDEDKELYKEPFTSSQGKFTIDDKVLPSGVEYIWSQAGNYGMKATAYVNNTDHAAESWLISPVIDLSKAEGTSISFSHALNFFASVEAAKSEATVWVKVNGGEWTQLDGINYPESLSWTFVDNKLNTSAYDGKKVQFAFKYKSTEEKAGTWEIKNFVLKGKGEVAVEGDENSTPNPETVKFVKATQIESGKKYLMVAEGKVALLDSRKYGYIYVEDANMEGDAICQANENNAYTIEASGNGYTIKQHDGRYLYQTGNYNSFNFDEAPTEGNVWSFEADQNRKFIIKNLSTQKYIQYSIQYTSYGCYADEQGVLPELYVQDETSTNITSINTNTRHTVIYNLQGQRVKEAAKGLYIIGGKKVLVK